MNFQMLGAILAAVAVTCGAFGAHALRDVLSPERHEVWRTAVFYNLTHAIVIFVLGLKGALSHYQSIAATGMVAGVLIFSGSLYALCLMNMRWLGAITPIGGTLWIGAWLLLALSSRQP